jgi:hypothetical protein
LPVAGEALCPGTSDSLLRFRIRGKFLPAIKIGYKIMSEKGHHPAQYWLLLVKKTKNQYDAGG